VHRCGIGYRIFGGFLVNRLREITWNGMTNMWHLIISAPPVRLGLVWREGGAGVADLWFVLLTVGLFAVLALLVKAVERL
jgi:hypothetical protein